MRMPKGWTLVGTNDLGFGNTETKADKIKRDSKFNKAIKNVKVRTYEEMQKEAERKQKEIEEYNEKIKEKSLETKELFQYLQIANGENAYLEYAFGAHDITDMIYRMSLVEQLTEYNDKMISELEEMIKANKKRLS